MAKIGVNWALRKAGALASSTTEITKVRTILTLGRFYVLF